MTKLKFKPYSPPKVTYKTTYEILPWKDSSTEESGWSSDGKYVWKDDVLQPASSQRDDEDTIDCDICGVATPWQAVEYVNDADGFTWHICLNCDPREVEDFAVNDLVSNEVAIVNRVLLDEDAE